MSNKNATIPSSKRERLTLQQFEELIRAEGEAQARLRNLQAVNARKAAV